MTNYTFVIDQFQPCHPMPINFPSTNQNYLSFSAQPMEMDKTEILERQTKNIHYVVKLVAWVRCLLKPIYSVRALLKKCITRVSSCKQN